MQPQHLIPTPLDAAHGSRKPIELMEPITRIRFRILRITLFLLGTFIRNILAMLWPPWKRTRFSPHQQAHRLRSFMEKMGGMWVKAGQIVALRRDLFPEEFCAELSRLQDRARGFYGHHARHVIEEELGRPIEEVFSEFDADPLAAASIGQVHAARLRNPDVEVVIKVRRPRIEESFEHDLGYLRAAVRLMMRFHVLAKFGWDDMYWEVERAIQDELDYHQEAASLRRMRKYLRKDKIYVPKVFLEYCTDRILVMERVRGVYMSEYIRASAAEPEKLQQWRKENKIKARKVGERLVLSFYRQLFEHNLYHCDLHPGNILLMRKSRITFIDFGSVGSSDKTMLYRLLQIFRAVAERDYNKVADYSLLLAPSLPNKDLSLAKAEIASMYRDFETAAKIKTLPYQQKSMGHVAGKIAEIWNAEGIPPAWGTLRSSRAELTLGRARN